VAGEDERGARQPPVDDGADPGAPLTPRSPTPGAPTGAAGATGVDAARASAEPGAAGPPDARPAVTAVDGAAGDGAELADTAAGADAGRPELGGAPAAVVIDTHTHFWDTAREPPPGRSKPVPFASPDRPILPEHYEKVAVPAGITGTVVVEASPWLEDNDWLLAQAKKSRLIVGVIGNLSEVLGKPTFKPAFDRLSADPLYRGIRVNPGDLGRAELKEHLAALADKGLMVDVNANGPSAVRTVGMHARNHPKLKIVLDHAGYIPFAREPTADWSAALEAAAAAPNVYCKVSRFQEQAATGGKAPTDVEAYRKTLDLLWKTFGEDRLIFGTNWPLSDGAGTLGDAVKLVRRYLEGKGGEAVEKVLWKNAKAVYGWVAR
jgi:predicted TIM-barrel fold metal-dependent hydrolase